MIIKLLPQQVPVFWDAIKLGTTQADEVDSKDLQSYLNEMLHALLSDKAQCFVALDEGRILKGLLITRLMADKTTERKFLLLQALYVWNKLETADWSEAYNLVSQFASKEHCESLSFNSRNPAAWKRMEQYGFKEKTRTLEIKIGG